MMKAIAAALVVLGMFMTAGATPYAPKTRAPIYEPHRVSWPELRDDLHRRKAFRRTVRMSEESFVKLADLLRPALLKNKRFGSEFHISSGLISVFCCLDASHVARQLVL